MTRKLLVVIGLTAGLFVGIAGSQAAVLLDINFDGAPYGGDASAIQGVADPYGSWSANPWTIDTGNQRGGTASARQTGDPRVFVDFSPNNATKTNLVNSAQPLVFEWSFYRPTTTAEIRLIVRGGATDGNADDLWQLNLQEDGDVRFESEGMGDVFDAAGSLAGWWDFQVTMDLTGPEAKKEITSVLLQPPGAASFTEMLPVTRTFKNDGAFLNLLRWDGNNAGATADTAYDSISIVQVPEPLSIMLSIIGFIATCACCRGRNQATDARP